MPIVIVDIDNTILKYGNVPIKKTVDKVNELAKKNKIVIVSGRLESDRKDTIGALKNAGVNYSRIMLNKIGSSTPDQLESKRQAAESLKKDDNVILAIDDDPRARKIYKELGIRAMGPGG